MKMKNEGRVIFTPGFSSQTLTSDYYEIDNMLIIGDRGTCKVQLANSILKSLMDCNEAKGLNLVCIDPVNYESNPFCNPKRLTPSMQVMKYLYREGVDYETQVTDFLEYVYHVYCIAQEKTFGDFVETAGLQDGKLVVYINNFSSLSEKAMDLVNKIMLKNLDDIAFILVDEVGTDKCQCLDKFRYRIVTRTFDLGISEAVLYCSLGLTNRERGTFWFLDTENPDVYKRYEIQQVNTQFISRMLKTFASNKVVNTSAVTERLKESFEADLSYSLENLDKETFKVWKSFHEKHPNMESIQTIQEDIRKYMSERDYEEISEHVEKLKISRS